MTDTEWARQVTVAPERLGGWIARFTKQHGDLAIDGSATVVLLRGTDGAAARIDVPYPPLSAEASDLVAGLLRHLHVVRTIGVLLVRRRGHAVGVFSGRELVASKVGTSYVQGKTKAGGWSQQRYARRRANQASAAYEEAADDALAVLLPRLGSLAAVVTGGDRAGLRAVLADDRLAPLLPLVAERVMPVPDPRLRVLSAVGEQLHDVRIDLNAEA